jgi:glycosyltransferase involved in cell wall biosynthesis
LNNNILDSWRNDWAIFLKNFNKFIVPSNSTKKIIENFYSVNAEVMEFGIELDKAESKKEVGTNGKYNIGFVGVMVPHKGSNILEELIKKVKGTNINIHLFGPSEIDKIKKNTRNYKYHGPYKRKDLLDLFRKNNIDLICMFSVCPETYSYTLTEVVACGIPVVALNIGAVGERVKEMGSGWLIKNGTSSTEILDKIKQVLNDKEEYQKVIKKIDKYKVKTIEEMSLEYKEIYDLSKSKKLNKENMDILKKIIKETTAKPRVYSNELDWILNSVKWRIISKVKVPKIVKKVVKKLMRKY